MTQTKEKEVYVVKVVNHRLLDDLASDWDLDVAITCTEEEAKKYLKRKVKDMIFDDPLLYNRNAHGNEIRWTSTNPMKNDCYYKLWYEKHKIGVTD